MSGMGQVLRRLVLVAVLAPMLVVGAYAWIFGPDSNYSLSHHGEDWARFGEYVGGSLGALYGLMAFVGVLLTIRQQQAQARRDVHAARSAARAAREANVISRAAYLSDQRPWVMLDNVNLSGATPVTYSQADGWRVTLGYSLRNVGKSPAARAAFSAQIIPFMLGLNGPGGTFEPQTDIAKELRLFANDRAQVNATSPVGIFGALMFPNQEPTMHFTSVSRGDSAFLADMASSRYSGNFIVLVCVSYRSTLDDSMHVTAQAYALHLMPDPVSTGRMEVINGQSSALGRIVGMVPHPMGDSYAT
jgi:hypothetical protein